MSEITPGIGEGEQEARAVEAAGTQDALEALRVFLLRGLTSNENFAVEFTGPIIAAATRKAVLAEVEARIEDRRSPWVLGGAHRVTWNLALDAALASVRDLGGNDG